MTEEKCKDCPRFHQTCCDLDEDAELSETPETPDPAWADEWNKWKPTLPQADEVEEAMIDWQRSKKTNYFLRPSAYRKIMKEKGLDAATRAYWESVKTKWNARKAKKRKDATVIEGFK